MYRLTGTPSFAAKSSAARFKDGDSRKAMRTWGFMLSPYTAFALPQPATPPSRLTSPPASPISRQSEARAA